jgi:membrane dipeptidase
MERHMLLRTRTFPATLAWCLLLAAAAAAQETPSSGAAAGGAAADGDDPLLARARDIHRRVLTLDTHKDIPDQLAPETLPEDPEARLRVRSRFDPTFRGEAQVDFVKMREGGYDAAFFIVFVPQGDNDAAGFQRAHRAAMAKFDAIHRMARLHPEHIEIARSPADVRRIAASGKLVACIGIENGYAMGDDLGRIAEFYELGARYMSITHNRHSQLGDSHTPAEPLHGGLSELGRRAVAELNRLGIMVDVSHASKATMMDVLEVSAAPVLASHSGCRAVCDHSRNLDDEQLRALKRNRGVIQCVALGDFVVDARARDAAEAELRQRLGLPSREGRRRGGGEAGGGEAGGGEAGADNDLAAKMARFRAGLAEIEARYPAADVRDFVDHIDHAVQLIGVEHVAIASDFDGGGGVVGWNDASETFHVTLELVRRGYTEEQIAMIWSGNTLRLWAEVEAVARRLQAGAEGR